MKRNSIRLSRGKNNIKWLKKMSFKRDNKNNKQQSVSKLTIERTMGGKEEWQDIPRNGEQMIPTIHPVSKIKVGVKGDETTIREEWKRRWMAKQILKDFYDMSEHDYNLLKKKGLSGKEIIELQEKRADVIMFRVGWVNSIKEGKHILNNESICPIRANSYLKIGNSISISNLNWRKKVEMSFVEKPHRSKDDLEVNKCAPQGHLNGVVSKSRTQEENIYPVKINNSNKSYTLRRRVSWLKEVFNNMPQGGSYKCYLIREPNFKEIKLPRSLDMLKI